MMNGIEIQTNLSETNGHDNNLQIDTILYIDNTKENDLIQFIIKSQRKGFNCLDLSKRNIKEIPSRLLEFTSLQYLYLESNELTQLPNDIFIRLSNLKWLDLRNNKLTSIPKYGLAKHSFLQYLLLSGNYLRTLPFELGKVKTLSALNLDGNPLDYPPYDVIKQGIKMIQQYLRNEYDSNNESSSSSSSDDDQPLTPRSSPPLILPQKSKSETSYYETSSSNFLPPHLQSCIQYKRMTYSAIRPSSSIRPRSQSEMKNPQIKTKTNHLEREISTVQEQSLMPLKHRNIKIDDEIQELSQKSFLRIKDYEEPIIHTPFHIDPHYIQLMNNDQQNLTRYNNRRYHSAKSTKKDEERRIHEQRIQNRIYQITDNMLKRRLQARGSIFEEKRQVKLDLRKLHRLEFEGKQHRSIPIDHHLNTFNNHKKL